MAYHLHLTLEDPRDRLLAVFLAARDSDYKTGSRLVQDPSAVQPTGRFVEA
jgi:hypothetical protein